MTNLTTMYAGQANSPGTTLAGALSATATTVNVNDASILPAAPFPLTIGTDSSQSETVLVTAVNGNVLTVERGWDGMASAWGAATPCARVFTGRDLGAVQDNIIALQDGKAEADSVPAPSNAAPLMDGAAAPGSGTAYAREGHRHPTDTTRQAKITAAGLLKGDGNGGISAAVAGTDYAAPSMVPAASTANPQMDGTASPGSGTSYARGNHVHPTDTTRQAKITVSGLLKGDGSGGVSAAVAGTDYQSPLTAGTDYATPADLAGCIPDSEKGANSGVATLDANGKVVAAQTSARMVSVSSNTTLASSHAGCLILASGTVTITVPGTLDLGTEIEVMNYGTGTVTVKAASGVTLNGESAGSKLINDRYTSAVLKAITSAAWVIQGAIS